jgi:hypothetical protein
MAMNSGGHKAVVACQLPMTRTCRERPAFPSLMLRKIESDRRKTALLIALADDA